MVLRRRIRDKDGLIAIASEAVQQLSFLDEADNPIKLYEHVVLVTSFGREGYELRTIAQLYRDRGDCENGFDEIKNQWGWTGFTSQEIKRSTLMARHIALIYNWWSLFVRAAHPKARREAITSRPLLLNAVGRKTASRSLNLLMKCGRTALLHWSVCIGMRGGCPDQSVERSSGRLVSVRAVWPLLARGEFVYAA